MTEFVLVSRVALLPAHRESWRTPKPSSARTRCSPINALAAPPREASSSFSERIRILLWHKHIAATRSGPSVLRRFRPIFQWALLRNAASLAVLNSPTARRY